MTIYTPDEELNEPTMAIYNSDEEPSIFLPTGVSEFSDPPSPPSVDGANQPTMAIYNPDEDFLSSLTVILPLR
jgi:hypothetical protein